MRARHGAELAPAFGRELHGHSAAVGAVAAFFHQAFGDQAVGEAGDVAPRHHQAAREFAHLHAVGLTVQLRHQVEARQAAAELFAQARAQWRFNAVGAGQEPQPQAQRHVVVGAGPGF